MPIAFGKGSFAFKLKEHCPKSVLADAIVDGEGGVIYDAFYGQPLQAFLAQAMGEQQRLTGRGMQLIFTGNGRIREHFQEEKSKPKVLSGEQSNTSITYGNRFFLKMFRKLDRGINPDLEITRFLTEEAGFRHTPPFLGSIELKDARGTMILGMMQELVENTGDAWTYMLDRLDDYNDRILMLNLSNIDLPNLQGSLIDPLEYDQIPELVQEWIEASIAEYARLLGVRTGEMHIALSSGSRPEFKPEPYSLHYQRSLYAGLQSLVRSTFLSQHKNLYKLSSEVRREAEQVLAMKEDILDVLKEIYKHKIDVTKIRIHGDFHLGQVLFNGKDFMITDFEGEPARSYSERRLKRSPMRDVAGMIRSFHYAAYGSLFLDNQIRKEDFSKLIPFSELWYHYMSQFYINAYLDTVEGRDFAPGNRADLETLLTTFLLEKAIYELNYELNNRPDWVIIPLRGIKMLMKKDVAVTTGKKIITTV